MIRLLRVDDRLLHGQVSFSWIEALSLKNIVIVNYDASNDDFTKAILELSKPNDVKLQIMTIEEFEQKVENYEDNTILIVSSLFDAQKVITILDDKIDYHVDINIGGLRNRPNSVMMNEYVYLTSEDTSIISSLLEQNCYIYMQRLPNESIKVITSKLINLQK
ncbi:MAG: PTS sugar transporter subunit IIB [Erysipelotrichaceae bacterium]|nr:PTS sugar transporter subunit IIB [Erysipelotrichaceae bacterium]